MNAKSTSVFSYLLLLSLGVLLLTYQLDTYPNVWFDEGFKLNAARTLSERGVYGTYTANGYVPFDPNISSGPLDIIPMAISFKLLGIGIVQARLVSILLTLVTLLSIYTILIYLYDKRAALFICLMLLAAPKVFDQSFLYIGRQVLGEPGALAAFMLGLWMWFESWRRGSLVWAVLAGLAIGLGFLSKPQSIAPLIPTLAIVAGARWAKMRINGIQQFVPIIVIGLVVLGWVIIGQVGTPADIRLQNSTMLADAIRTHLLTGLWGKSLTSGSKFIALILFAAVCVGFWRVFRQPALHFTTHSQWAEFTLTLFVLILAIWYTLFSVGWPRYAYAGFVVALLLLGKTVWDIIQWVYCRFARQHPNPPIVLDLLIYCTLVILAIGVTITEVRREVPSIGVEETADFIAKNIPADAVIETWEWELDAISGHWNYHHPDQRILFEAIRQFSHEGVAFNLQYDLLEGNPDYLITGQTSDWIGIYDPTEIKRYFHERAEFGSYHIYQRIK